MTINNIDFLKPDNNQIRHQIKGIDESYSHEWDILAELVQNSVDAIRSTGSNNGLIEVEINKDLKSIKVRDNGVGISSVDVPILLRPFSSGKKGRGRLIGEKGVGLTFAMFAGNLFSLKTCHNNVLSEATVKNAYAWKTSDDDSEFYLSISSKDVEAENFTEITISDIKIDSIFELKFEQIEFVLRTKTAIGNTEYIFNSESEFRCQATLSLIDREIEVKKPVEFKYLLPTDLVTPSSKENLDTFVSWTQDSDRTDADKRIRLKDKIIYKIGTYGHNPSRPIRFYACFIPKNWDPLTEKFLNLKLDDPDLKEFLESTSYTQFGAGVFTSVKSMPTGISIQNPSTGYAGYWGRFFMLLEDDMLKFDIGRKSIHGNQQKILKECAHKIFNDFIKYISKYVAGNPEIPQPSWNRDEILADIEKLIDLRTDKVKFKKNPHSQEASVAAIFYECVGNGLITGIRPVLSGYRDKYDLFAEWGNKKVFIEFKSSLSNLKKDFNDARKMFDEMDCVVCWGITDDDTQTLSNMGIDLHDLDDESEFSSGHDRFPSSTHRMSLSGFSKTVYVIDLKKLVSE